MTWHTSNGLVTPQASVTDAAGIATASWTLDTVAGTRYATASVTGLNAVGFRATALAGPAALIQKVLGDSQTMGVNARFSSPLGVLVTDRYRNAVSGKVVTWTVVNGPVRIIREDIVDGKTGSQRIHRDEPQPDGDRRRRTGAGVAGRRWRRGGLHRDGRAAAIPRLAHWPLLHERAKRARALPR